MPIDLVIDERDSGSTTPKLSTGSTSSEPHTAEPPTNSHDQVGLCAELLSNLGVVHNCEHYQKHTQSSLFCDPSLPPSQEYFENLDF